jgi:hypothetical protein
MPSPVGFHVLAAQGCSVEQHCAATHYNSYTARHVHHIAYPQGYTRNNAVQVALEF